MTITLQEDVARWARVWAAEHDTSVSRLVGEMLERRMLDENGYGAAMEEFLSRRPVTLKRSGKYPRRQELHGRRRLR